MTGTSIDALDASLVEIEGEGLSMRARHLRSVTRGLGTLAASLRSLADQVPMSAAAIAGVSHEFAMAHVSAIRALLGEDGTQTPDLICIHGQTVHHKPPVSWQLMNAAPVAASLGCPVVFDLRGLDIARGGQGAPITPIADLILFSHATERRVVVNLGGFANYTVLPPTASRKPCVACVRGGDVCVCNQLLDRIARDHMGVPYDEGGRYALGGKTDEQTAETLYAALRAQYAERRSLGTGDEMGELIRTAMGTRRLSGGDLARTACDAIGRVIAHVVRGADRVLLAGGGCQNTALVSHISSYSGTVCSLTDDFGVPAPYREAVCFAVLGALCQDREEIALPGITGGKGGLSGAWVYP